MRTLPVNAHVAISERVLCADQGVVKLQPVKGIEMEDVNPFKSQTVLNRLRWRSRRGMAELDVLFVPFFEEAFDALSNDMKRVYARMLLSLIHI